MRYLVLAALALFSSFSFSADYFWYIGSIHTSVHYSSASSACLNSFPGPTSNIWYEYVSVSIQGQTGTCSLKRYDKSYYSPYNVTQSTTHSSVYRSGDSCPVNATYNAVTGACDLPNPDQGQLCPDQSGASVALPKIVSADGTCVNYVDADLPTTCKYLGNISATENVKVAGVILPADSTDPNATPNVVPPAKFKNPQGCEALIVGAPACTYTPGRRVGDKIIRGGGSCEMTVQYSGKVASVVPPDNGKAGKDDVCLDKAKCNLPLPKKLDDSKPCNYTTAADGSQTCVSERFTGKEGQTQCGTVNGVLTCSDAMAKAVGNGLSIATTVKTENIGDGKTKTTKTDVLTSTTCTGVLTKDCITGVTTTTSTTIKDGTGKTESASGTCSGPQCPDKNTNPDGDGDGFGDCTGDDCGEGEEGGTPFETPELEEVDTYLETTQKFYGRVKGSPLISGLGGISAPSGSCWTPTLDAGRLGTVVIDGHCQVLAGNIELIRLIARTLWAFAAVWIFFG